MNTATANDLNYYTGYSLGWLRKRDTSAAGDHTDLHIANAREAAVAEGYRPVGNGPTPRGGDVIYLPTCSSPGFAGKCEKLYFSRWYRSAENRPVGSRPGDRFAKIDHYRGGGSPRG